MKIKSNLEIEEFLKKIAEPLNIEIVEVEFKMSKNPQLTVFIDTNKEGGVDLNLCELFHNAINEPLDELDPTFGMPYTLNVSSPGLDRPFKTDKDYLKNVGEEVELKLFAPMKGNKNFEGILLSYDKNSIVVKAKEEEIKFSLNQIAKITKAIKF